MTPMKLEISVNNLETLFSLSVKFCNHLQRSGRYTSINPFVPNWPFLYPLKTSENRKVFWCFQEIEKGRIGKEWVKDVLRDRSFITFAKCSKKLIFLAPWYAFQGVRNVSFLENFVNVINEWSLTATIDKIL